MLSDTTATATATAPTAGSRFAGAITAQNGSLNNLATAGTSAAAAAVAAASAAAAVNATPTVIVTSGSAAGGAAAANVTTHTTTATTTLASSAAAAVAAAAAAAVAASTSQSQSVALSAAAVTSLELPIRLRLIAGFQARVNDVIYCPPLVQTAEEPTTVVYFGGDVQDFSENMETSRDSKSYIKFNLDATALLLRQDFPKSHILLVRPSRMEFKTFSCFDNFVRGNNAGVPDHTPMHHSLQHLEKLLQNISLRLLGIFASGQRNNGTESGATSNNSTNNHNPQQQQAEPAPVQFDLQDMDIDILQVQETVTVDTNGTVIDTTMTDQTDVAAVAYITSIGENGDAAPTTTSTEDGCFAVAKGKATAAADHDDGSEAPWWLKDIPKLDKCKLILVGFSKGCVVLNQFIYEFHYLKTLTPDDVISTRLLTRIAEMYWLDGGHGGAKNTWITSRSLLETLTRLAIQIHVHVTPYQVQDERRPWIRREEKTFVDLLRRLGAPLQRYLHFETAPANLFTHFEVLQVFRQVCPSQLAAHINPTFDDDDDEK